MKAGNYQAKVTNYGVTTTKAGAPMLFITFSTTTTGEPVKWLGYLSDKAKKNTLKTIFSMGFSGLELSDLAAGPSAGVLDTTKTYEIEVEVENFAGKEMARVRWINSPKGLDKSSAAALLAGFAADVLEVKQEMGIGTTGSWNGSAGAASTASVEGLWEPTPF